MSNPPMHPATYHSAEKVCTTVAPSSLYVLPNMTSTYSIINLNSESNNAHTGLEMNSSRHLREGFCPAQENVSVTPSSSGLYSNSNIQQQHAIQYSLPSYSPHHSLPSQMALPPISSTLQSVNNTSDLKVPLNNVGQVRMPMQNIPPTEPMKVPSLAQLLSEDMQLIIDDIVRKFASTSTSVRGQVLDQILTCLTDLELDKFVSSLTLKVKSFDRSMWSNTNTYPEGQHLQWINRDTYHLDRSYSYQRNHDTSTSAQKNMFYPTAKAYSEVSTQTDFPAENDSQDIHCKNCVCTDKQVTKRQYVCEHCSKSFTRWRMLKIHMRKHEEKNPFKCVHCKQQFSSRPELLSHRKTHPIHRPFLCTLCLKGFTSKSSLKTHQLLHAGVRQFKCSYCERSFMHKSNLITHMKIHTGNLSYSCNICDKKFARWDHLNEHQKVTHSNEKPHTCSFCGKQFKWKNALTQHESRHTDPKSYPCGECGKVFPHTSNLRMHMRIHSGNKPHVCKYCSKGFIQKSDLVRHETTHTGIKPLQCLHCPRTFTRKRELKIHEKTHLTNL